MDLISAVVDPGRSLVAEEVRQQGVVGHAEPAMDLERAIDEQGYSGLYGSQHAGTWMEWVGATYPLWRARIDDAIRARQVGAAVWENAIPEWRHHYRKDVEMERSERLFSKSGYRAAYRSGPYLIWLRSPGRP